MSNIKELFEEIVEDGVITRDEHDMFMDMIHADGQIDAEESEQISRMFRLIKEGKLRIVDSDREISEKRRRDELRKKLEEKKSGG